MHSIWDNVAFPAAKPLSGDTEAEAVVIGAGMAGLLTAYTLRQRGIQAVVMDAVEPLHGVTRFTSAKVTSQHGLIYADLIRTIGKEAAGVYASSMQRAVDAYEEIVEHENVDCEWQRLPAYLYSTNGTEALREERAAAALLGLPAETDSAEELPFPTAGALRFDRQASFHPLKFLAAIAKDVPVWSHTFAQIVDGHTVFTDRGCVSARHIVIATNYPFVNFPGHYFLRMHRERHRTLAITGTPVFHGMYLDVAQDGLSLRQSGAYLLCGGDGRRTGNTEQTPRLERQVRRLWPQAKIAARWWTQDCVTHDRLPFIGRYAASRPDWYVATGFNKWGMTGSMVAASVITDLILGKETPESRLFSPSRHLKRAAVPFLRDTGHSIKGLTSGLFSHDDRRCPHMGCRMKYNEAEGVWECPCHGSTYSTKGDWLYGPATRRHFGEKHGKGD